MGRPRPPAGPASPGGQAPAPGAVCPARPQCALFAPHTGWARRSPGDRGGRWLVLGRPVSQQVAQRGGAAHGESSCAWMYQVPQHAHGAQVPQQLLVSRAAGRQVPERAARIAHYGQAVDVRCCSSVCRQLCLAAPACGRRGAAASGPAQPGHRPPPSAAGWGKSKQKMPR